ncbi:Dynamin-2A [Platanthera zijinensis]|uniref:Dynamin-2A n=1 Tax=Platanthera zijinensis TaxID=2320716 RepID=A0AAP0FVD6_9ASPA
MHRRPVPEESLEARQRRRWNGRATWKMHDAACGEERRRSSGRRRSEEAAGGGGEAAMHDARCAMRDARRLQGKSQIVHDELFRLGEQMVHSSEGTRAIALELCREFEDKFLLHISSGELMIPPQAPLDPTLCQEANKEVRWWLEKVVFGTSGTVPYTMFLYYKDNILLGSRSGSKVRDPDSKRTSSSGLAYFAVGHERRMRVVEMGGAQDLLEMLEGARDDKTRKEALKALLSLSHSDAVAEVLRQSGAAVLVASVPDSLEFHEIGNCKSSLLEQFREPEHNPSPSLVRPTP